IECFLIKESFMMEELEGTKQKYYEDIFHAAKANKKEDFRALFLKLHTKDQMELFHLLYPENKKKIADFIQPLEFAPIFEYMDFEDQENASEYLPTNY